MMRLPTDEVFVAAGSGAHSGSDERLPPSDATGRGVPPRPAASLYTAQAPRLLRFFMRRSGSDAAPDLVHDSFVRFWGVASSPSRPVHRPEAYLTTIARNLAGEGARTAVRRSTALHVPSDDVDLIAPCPVAQLEARDVLVRLETAMAGLRPITREIFMAHRLDGYSYREIAEHTGLSVKRVEKHMSRALKQLDHILGAGL